MSQHTIVCRSCGTEVAQTPNKKCVKCGAPDWGRIDTGTPGAQPGGTWLKNSSAANAAANTAPLAGSGSESRSYTPPAAHNAAPNGTTAGGTWAVNNKQDKDGAYTPPAHTAGQNNTSAGGTYTPPAANAAGHYGAAAGNGSAGSTWGNAATGGSHSVGGTTPPVSSGVTPPVSSTKKTMDLDKVWSGLGFAFAVVLLWHIKVAAIDSTKLAGLFKTEPECGYTWQSGPASERSATRYFWQGTKAIWTPGIQHPLYHAVAATTEGKWEAMPGYVFSGKEGDLSTKWQPGMVHPTIKAYAMNTEGRWMPLLGYDFIMQNGYAVGTKWAPGKRYESLKISAGQAEGTYNAFPGYRFKDADKSLDVEWVPGMRHPYNGTIAGTREGSWEERPVDRTPTAGDHFVNYIVGGLSGKLIEWLFGEDNPVSNKLYEESVKEGVRAVIKATE